MQRQRRIVVIGVLYFLGGHSTGLAQDGNSYLPVDTILQALNFEDFKPDLSPDGKWLAYSLRSPVRARFHPASDRMFSSTGVPTSATGTDVWITNTFTGKSENVTAANGSSWGASWSPDSKLLAFYSDRDGHARVWLYDISSKSVRCLSNSL